VPIDRILCTNCGSKYHYQTFCPYKKKKAISQRGKQTLLYEAFRDTVAKPYLDNKYGHVCSYKGCTRTEGLDVNHKKSRGAHAELKFELKNLEYLCREHHSLFTDGKLDH
jgi:hypothetical protein